MRCSSPENGTGLSRKQIWAEMKSVCEKARVAASKVFPHNLRHLFARTFYKVCRDVARLADVAGAQFHRDHQDLPDLYGGGAPVAAGADAPGR